MDGFSVPAYTLSQTPTAVQVTVVLPALSGQASQPAKIAAASRIFAFHCGAHYLPLVFPSPLVAPESTDVSPSIARDGAATYHVTLLKGTVGEWPGLDTLQPQLMPDDELSAMEKDAELKQGMFAPSSSHTDGKDADQDAQGLLQRGLANAGLVDLDAPVQTKDADSLPETAATPMQTQTSQSSPQGFSFGLESHHDGALLPAGESDVRNILEVQDPSEVPPDRRAEIAEEWENERWDEGVYLDNFLDFDGELAALLSFRLPAPQSKAAGGQAATAAGSEQLSVQQESLLLQLLFGYTYELQANYGETTVESSWTVAKLSRSLCASAWPFDGPLVVPQSAQLEQRDIVLLATLRAVVRRSLVVPLYRHWQLSMLVLSHVASLLKSGGRDGALATLASIADMFESDPVGTAVLSRLNQVWVRPLASNIEALAGDASLSDLGKRVEKLLQSGLLSKDFVGGEAWDLEVSEQAARMAVEEGEGGFV